MRRLKYAEFCLIAVAASFSLWNCSSPTDNDHAGNSSQTGNAIVSGRLYKSGGPAIGAKVFFVPVSHNPNPVPLPKAFAATDTVITDSTGTYGTNDLDSGIYNVFGTDNSGNLSLIDSVHVTGDSQVVPPDTLKLPGSLTGTIKMQGRDDPASVLIMPFGTFIKPDPTPSTGLFSMSNLAEGSYSIRFMSILDRYLHLDTSFTITAGQPLVLDSIVLPLKIPTPTGFVITYDTLKQIVTLSWDRMDTSRVKGYNVYRQRIDTAEVKLNAQPLADTFYVDSMGIQDQTYIYSVIAVDFEDKEGIKTSGVSIVLVSIFAVTDSIVNGYGFQDGQFGYNRFEMDNKGYYYLADGNGQRFQKLDSLGHFIFKIPLASNVVDVALGDSGMFFVSDQTPKKIFKADSQGNIFDTLNTVNPPAAIQYFDSILYVATAVGLETYDQNDSLIDSIRVPFIHNYTSRDLSVLNDTLYVMGSGELFRFNELEKTFTMVFQLPDPDNNQNARIDFLNNKTLLITARHTDLQSTIKTQVFVVDRLTGSLIAIWKSPLRITDINVNGNIIKATTDNGRIFTLQIRGGLG